MTAILKGCWYFERTLVSPLTLPAALHQTSFFNQQFVCRERQNPFMTKQTLSDSGEEKHSSFESTSLRADWVRTSNGVDLFHVYPGPFWIWWLLLCGSKTSVGLSLSTNGTSPAYFTFFQISSENSGKYVLLLFYEIYFRCKTQNICIAGS